MFLMAGFDPHELVRGRMLCWAYILPARTYGRRRLAQLWRFRSGDVAWLTKTFIAWPHQCRTQDLIRGYYVPAYLQEYSSPLPGAL